MNQISKTEEAVKAASERIRFLEKKLRNHFLPKTKQKEIKRELSDVRKLLETHQVQLVKLKTRDRKSSIIAFIVGIFAIFIIIYMFYTLIDVFILIWDYWNEDSDKYENVNNQ